MIHELEYTSPVLQGHKELGLAISSAKAYHLAHFKNDIDACVGRTVQKIDFGDQYLRIYFEADVIFEVNCVEDEIAYYAGSPRTAPTGNVLGEIVCLRSGGHAFTWARKEMIQNLARRLFRKIFIGPDGIYLYFDMPEILSVRILYRADVGSPFLYWHLGD